MKRTQETSVSGLGALGSTSVVNASYLISTLQISHQIDPLLSKLLFSCTLDKQMPLAHGSLLLPQSLMRAPLQSPFLL